MNPPHRDLTPSIALFCSVIAATMTALYHTLRIGFATNIPAVLGTLAIALVLINLPLIRAAHRNPTRAAAWIIGGVIFALLVSWLMWAGPNSYPLSAEAVTLGRYGPDTLYHASMISMIRTYGVPTTGIDGIPYVPYHFGSYLIYTAILAITGAQPIDFYEYSVPILALPFFLSRLLTFALDVRRFANLSDAHAPSLIWLTLIAAFAGIIPLDLSLLIGETRWVMMRSDSHLWGMALIFTLFSLILRELARRPADLRRFSPALLIALPLILGMVGLIKLSVLYVLAALMVYSFLRFGLYRYPRFVFSFAAAMLVGLAVYLIAAPHSYLAVIRPLGYLRTWVPLAWWPIWLILAMFWPLLIALIRLRTPSRPMLDLEVLAVLVIVGLAPSLLFDMPIQDAIWFLEVSKWVAVALLIAYLPLIVPTLRALKARPLRPAAVTAWLIGLSLAWIMLANVISEANETLRRNLRLRVDYSQYADHTDDDGIRALFSRIQSTDGLAEFLLNHWRYTDAPPHAPMVALLHDLRALPRSEKRQSILFIPQSNDDYWEMGHRTFSRVCQTTPFIAPAITGIAMLDARPDPACNAAFWGYEIFGQRTTPQSLSAADPAALCRRATDLGFRTLIVIEALTVERITCD